MKFWYYTPGSDDTRETATARWSVFLVMKNSITIYFCRITCPLVRTQIWFYLFSVDQEKELLSYYLVNSGYLCWEKLHLVILYCQPH